MGLSLIAWVELLWCHIIRGRAVWLSLKGWSY